MLQGGGARSRRGGEEEEEEADAAEEAAGDAEEVGGPPSVVVGGGRRGGTAFDAMNNLVAHMLSNLTASMRFAGSLNVDLNELTSTLVPFPRLHFLSASLAPLLGAGLSAPPGRPADPRLCERVVTQAFGNAGLLVRGDLRRGTHLACGLLARGPFAFSDMTAAAQRGQRELRMARWNQDGFKLGLCAAPSLYSDVSAMCVSNNCSVATPLTEGYERFVRLYQARAHLHHFLEFIDVSEIAAAAETVTGLIADYREAAGGP